MKDLAKQVENLSPKKRALFELLLKEKRRKPARGQVIPRCEPAPRYPLSFAQERLWFLDQLDPGSPSYNVHFPAHLAGPLKAPALEQSLNEIIRRHAILRTIFREDDQPYQVTLPAAPITLLKADLSDLPEPERRRQIQRLAKEQSRKSFDLANGPLMEMALLRKGEQEHIVLLVMHHIVFDGWSIGVFLNELSQLYEAFSAGRPSRLPELPVQYCDYACWQRERLSGAALDELLSYWMKRLDKKIEPLDLPVDREPPQAQTMRGAYQAFLISPETAASLKELSRREEATLFMLLLAVFQTLLSRYSGQRYIAVGSPAANRHYEETEPLIGCFLNTLLLCADMSGNPTFRESLARVREMTMGAYAHQDLPFEMLVDALQPRRQTNHTPLFRVWFVLQNFPAAPFSLPGLTMNHVWVDEGPAQFDLALLMVESSYGIEGCFHFNLDIIDAATVDEIKDHFVAVIRAVIADPLVRLLEIPLSEEARPEEVNAGSQAGVGEPEEEFIF